MYICQIANDTPAYTTYRNNSKMCQKRRYIITDSEESNMNFTRLTLELASKNQNEITVRLANELRFMYFNKCLA